GVPSEYERLTAELQPLLVNVTVAGVPSDPSVVNKLAALDDEDLDFLAGETEINRAKLRLLSASAKLEQEAARKDAIIPSALFYVLSRRGLAADLATLGHTTPRTARIAAEQALDDNLIPAALRGALTELIDQLHQLAVNEALNTPPTPGRPAIGALLAKVVP